MQNFNISMINYNAKNVWIRLLDLSIFKLLFVTLIITITPVLVYAQFNKLAWADEFDGKGLPDKTKWDYEEGYIRNKEKQYYTRERKENVRQESIVEGLFKDMDEIARAFIYSEIFPRKYF